MKEFLKVLKTLRSKCYANRLTEFVNIENKKIVFFYSGKNENNFLQICRYFEHFRINLDFVCLPDNHLDVVNFNRNISIIPLSKIMDLTVNHDVVMFTCADFVGFKFWEYFRNANVKYILPIGNPQFFSSIYDILYNHIEEIYEVYCSLDMYDGSREIYVSSLYGKVSNCMDNLIFNAMPPYFLEGYLPEDGDVMIDGGAYDGKTAWEFMTLGCEVYSFEMDEENYMKGKKSADTYGFTLEKMGLGSKKSIIKYKSADLASRCDVNGELTANIIDIDSYVDEKGLQKIDFIKLDIEGSELEALKGAASSIAKWKPTMAICMYHKLEDLWEIPLYIKSLRPDYKFSFRHHLIDARFEPLLNQEEKSLLDAYGLDYFLVSQDETVLYCR